MFRKYIALVIFLSFTSPVFADEISHRQAVEEMMVSTKTEKMMDSVYVQMDGMFLNMTKELNIPLEQRPLLEKYLKRQSDILRAELNWAWLKSQLVDVYVKVYTEEEIREITAFYNSPIGQKFIAKMPELMQASMQIMQGKMKEMIPKMEALMQEMRTDIEASKRSDNKKKGL